MSAIPKVTAILIAATLMAPVTSFAQNATGGAAPGSPVGTPNAGSAGAGTTGVSGIPAGPGSVGGNNNSINDPSGVGNAAKMPSPNIKGSATGTPGH
jgi:hypothetical protein